MLYIYLSQYLGGFHKNREPYSTILKGIEI